MGFSSIEFEGMACSCLWCSWRVVLMKRKGLVKILDGDIRYGDCVEL